MFDVDAYYGDDHSDLSLRFLSNYADDDSGLQSRANVLLRVGRDDAKAPIDMRPFFSWDVSSVPSNATVTGAEIHMRAEGTTAGSFPSTLEAIPAGEAALNDSLVGTWYARTSTRCSVKLYDWFVADRSATIAETSGLRFESTESGVHESTVLATSSGQVTHLWTRMRRSATIATGTAKAELWTATGTAGNYSAGTLIQSSSTIDVASGIGTVWDNELFVLDSAATVVSGTNYIVKVIVSFTSSDASAWVELGKNDASGSATLNIRQQANLNNMRGFNPWLYPGQAAWDITGGSPATIPTPLTVFTDNLVYTFGSIGPYVDRSFEVSGMTSLLQSMLDARTAGQTRIGMFWEGLDSTDSEWRDFDGTNSGTVVKEGLYGVVLRLRYDLPDAIGCVTSTFGALSHVSSALAVSDIVSSEISGGPRVTSIMKVCL